MSFNELLQTDAASLLAEFGESVTYTPFNGVARTITAIVDRVPDVQVGPNGETTTPKLEILVANSATTGISSSELDASGNDRVTVAVRYGATAESLGVYLPPAGSRRAHDAGMLALDLR